MVDYRLFNVCPHVLENGPCGGSNFKIKIRGKTPRKQKKLSKFSSEEHKSHTNTSMNIFHKSFQPL